MTSPVSVVCIKNDLFIWKINTAACSMQTWQIQSISRPHNMEVWGEWQTDELTIETLAWRRALFSSWSCLQRNLHVSSSIFNTLFSCFKRDMRFFSLWATDEVLSSALMSLSLNPVTSIEELNELAILETLDYHNALRVLSDFFKNYFFYFILKTLVIGVMWVVRPTLNGHPELTCRTDVFVLFHEL